MQQFQSQLIKLDILLLADDNPRHANTILDHINAFFKHSVHKIYLYNPVGLNANRFLDLNEFDVVVVHYSLATIYEVYVAHDLRDALHDYQGLIIQYIQDDYRQVNEYTDMMRYFGTNVLFTPYPPEKIPQIYNEQRVPNAAKYTTLTGYVPDRYVNMVSTPIETRPIDVGYRGRNLPYWLGQLSQEKTWIAQGFLSHASKYGLNCDIAWMEENRIYGADWDQFISSCKAMLGTESGASITDFDGMAERKTREYLQSHPDATFWEVYDQVLKEYEGNLVENTISPRIFECAAHRTALILFPGEYSGIIQPWIHYIPLEKDFSNMDQVVQHLHDNVFLQDMVERAYVDIIASGKYSYGAMIQEFDSAISQHRKPEFRARSSKTHYFLALVERHIRITRDRIIHLTYKSAQTIIPPRFYSWLRNIYWIVRKRVTSADITQDEKENKNA
jgi:hypothetical protein